MAKAIRQVTVEQKLELSPNMRRVLLQGTDLADFPTGYEGGYIKLVLPSQKEKPTVRSYTVREFDADRLTLSIDMVAHGDTGPAASWAIHSQLGENVSIQGPGACQSPNVAADFFLLAGDMSAMPAISVCLEQLPQDARGDVLLEVICEADKVDLQVPPGMQVHWVLNPDPESNNTVLEDAVMALPWRDGQASVWVAGEFSTSRTLRRYFRQTKQVSKEYMYVSCYWKIGETDEGMKAAKRADIDAWQG